MSESSSGDRDQDIDQGAADSGAAEGADSSSGGESSGASEGASESAAPEAETENETSSDAGEEGSRQLGAVSLGSFELSEALPEIDFNEVESLFSPSKIEHSLNRVEKNAEFLPALAQELVRQHAPEEAKSAQNREQEIRVSAEAVRSRSAVAKMIHAVIEFFSEKMAARFDAYLVKKATGYLEHTARRVNKVVVALADSQKPKEEFLKEVETLYNSLVSAPKEGSEKAVHKTHKAFANILRGGLHPKETPFINGVSAFYRSSGDREQKASFAIKAATPEIIQGMERFLSEHNVPTEPDPHVTENLTHRIVGAIAPKKLEATPEKVARSLEKVFRALPEDGEQFAHNFNRLCQNVVNLANQGHSGRTIVEKLLHEVKKR